MNEKDSKPSLLALAEGHLVARYFRDLNTKSALQDGLDLLNAWAEEGGDTHLSKLYRNIIQETTPENTQQLRLELINLNIDYYSNPLHFALEGDHPYSHSLRNLIDSL